MKSSFSEAINSRGLEQLQYIYQGLRSKAQMGTQKGHTRLDVEQVIISPDQAVTGDLGIIVAQSRKGDGLLRIPYRATEEGLKVLTLYWTSKIDKYWEKDK